MSLHSCHKIMGRGRFDPVDGCAKRMEIRGRFDPVNGCAKRMEIRGRFDPVKFGA